jgi:hypothetical protein
MWAGLIRFKTSFSVGLSSTFELIKEEIINLLGECQLLKGSDAPPCTW